MLRMRRTLNALAALAIATTMPAQAPQNPEQALKDALLHKTLYVQGFSAEKEVHFVWTGTSLEIPDAPIHTLGALKIKNVKVGPNLVEIDGDRSTLVKMENGKLGLSDVSTPVKLTIELRDADPSTLARLPDVLFFHDEQQAIANLPDAVRSILPAPATGGFAHQKNPSIGDSVKPCDCAQNDEHGCGRHHDSPGFEFPHHISRPPTLALTTEAAITRKKVFISSVAYSVTADGRTFDFWLAAPAGYGIDEEFLAAMAREKFHPATCHGQPITAPGGMSSIVVAPH